MDRSVNQACPRCDYSHGPVRGTARAGNGLLYCMRCGSSWRDLGALAPAAALRKSRGNMPSASANPAGMRAGPAHPADSRRPGRITLAAASVLCLIAAFAGGRSLMVAQSASQIEITDLSARQVQRDGRIAVRIDGRLSNRSSVPIALGQVDIVLSQASGHRIYSWVHHPAVDRIEPGQTIRFSTADGSVPEVATRVEIRAGKARISTPL